jgi:hypothetical protein
MLSFVILDFLGVYLETAGIKISCPGQKLNCLQTISTRSKSGIKPSEELIVKRARFHRWIGFKILPK